MHFQAGNRGFMPIEHEIGTLKERYGKLLLSDETCTVHGIDDGLRRFYVLESGSPERLSTLAGAVFSYLRSLQGGDPMINMLSYFDQGWMLLLFPRDRHRPWQYFKEGEDNILLSPASVDMGGSLITPLEKDFHKLTRADVVDIFQQLTFSKANYLELNRFIKQQEHE